jgi:ABC-2 type transport system permease protein
MPDLMTPVIRASAFVRKEVVEVLRQPALIAMLVLGPFAVLLLFGAGLGDLAPDVRAVFVAPEGSAAGALAEQFTTPAGSRLSVQGVTPDLEEALGRLERGDVDLVLELPGDAADRFRADERSTVVLYHDYLDPVQHNALILGMSRTIGAINDQVTTTLVTQSQQNTGQLGERVSAALEAASLLRQAVERGDEADAAAQRERLQRETSILADGLGAAPGVPIADGDAGEVLELSEAENDPLAALGGDVAALSDAPLDVSLSELETIEANLRRLREGLALFQRLSPEILVTPFTGATESVAGVALRLSDYYAPAVVVLLLQHMLITLVALSIMRERQLGTFELFRVAPLTTAEILVGKVLAAILIGAVVAAAVVGLLAVGLGVPLEGSLGWLAVSVGALLAASCGLGLVIALLARSDSQTIQLAMLVLLASILLSGFVLSLDYFLPPVRTAARLLPATHGVELVRAVMLRGGAPPLSSLAALAAMAAALLGLGWLLLGRRLARA